MQGFICGNTQLACKNRLFLPPMAREDSIDGQPSEKLIDYYRAMARKGFGLIILEHAYVTPAGKASPKQMGIDKHYNTDVLGRIADAIHEQDCRAVMQISHAGCSTRADLPVTFAPSKLIAAEKPALGKMRPHHTTRALTVEQIQQLVQAFVDAAVRVASLGYDGVEIHSAHGYLLNQFYSPLINKRTDDYGGSLLNRLRIHLEVLDGVHAALGDFPVLLRLGAQDYEAAGNTLQDACEAACVLAPHLSALDISGSFHYLSRHDWSDKRKHSQSAEKTVEQPDNQARSANGFFSKTSHAIRQSLRLYGYDTPVLLAGGLRSKSEAEAAILQGACDFAGIGRAALNPSFTL
ncbi:NADH:flavin oxidoreductase [Atopobium deltae]|uniref:Oxidoreductase, FAD/FMN-binding protein n=1 Tax=Atopobium deltae TaxID=1393034 RepID=A0A133XV65_9ACTN|nr:NADH:flavin oxidoreductase [Atopobium deltae]KXB34845.1 oxidoreductase, FAD/FMN-binding protein [Atopobium deltae]